MNQDNNPDRAFRQTRRSVVEKSIAMCGLSGFGMNSVRAITEKPRKEDYVGITYNPKNGNTTGEAHAKLTQSPDPSGGLEGTIRLGQIAFNVQFPLPTNAHPVDELFPEISDSGYVRVYRGRSKKHKRGRTPLMISLRGLSDKTVEGNVQHPGHDDTVAFSLEPKRATETKQTGVSRINRAHGGDA
jgi:hypothetical protein